MFEGKISLLVNEIKDRYVQENFQRIAGFLNKVEKVVKTVVYTTATRPMRELKIGDTIFNKEKGRLECWNGEEWVDPTGNLYERTVNVARNTTAVLDTLLVNEVSGVRYMIAFEDVNNNFKELRHVNLVAYGTTVSKTEYGIVGAIGIFTLTAVARAGGYYDLRVQNTSLTNDMVVKLIRTKL